MIVDNTVKSRRLKTNPSSKPIQFVVPPVNPNPIYDYKTKNRSFIRTAKQLELLGIKNHSFHLILINPLLQGVDPHSKDLHPQQVAWIIQECSVNIFYYLREVVRIDESGSPQKVRFRMDRGTFLSVKKTNGIRRQNTCGLDMPGPVNTAGCEVAGAKQFYCITKW